VRSKHIIRKAGVAAAVGLGTLLSTAATADTLLFPVIAVYSPNIATIISVVNDSGVAPRLRYIYRHKDAFAGGAPNVSGTCDTAAFNRNTYDNDVVSFDASGTLDGGSAMFGDVDTYGGSFALGASGPRRGYLLVTHAAVDGTPVATGNPTALSGEAVNLDIASGAAWGMRAINDAGRENFEFRNHTLAGGGVYSALPNGLAAAKRFTFFPLDEWSTRFFVTPIGANMDSANLSTIVRLFGDVYDRSRTAYPLPLITETVTCTARLDLEALMDATTEEAVTSSGGWGVIGPVGGGYAVIYKLEFVLDPQIYGGTNNNGYLLSDVSAP